jgi:hypothetical protein
VPSGLTVEAYDPAMLKAHMVGSLPSLARSPATATAVLPRVWIPVAVQTTAERHA